MLACQMPSTRDVSRNCPDCRVMFHNWWNAPKTWAKVQQIGPASHASWMENFPWTRLAHAPAPEGEKPMTDLDLLRACGPAWCFIR